MNHSILTGKNIRKSFHSNSVLNGIDIDIIKGEFLSIMGPSGSGKSTLLYSISGMDSIDDGEILFKGKNISNLKEREMANIRLHEMGFIFQNATMLKNLNMYDNIILPGLKSEKMDKSQIQTRADSLMDTTGISSLKDRQVTQVSGGELQRAGICRALINTPSILFGDEPTGALNSQSTEEIIALLKQINKDGITIMLVTHDAKVACESDRVLFMKDGQIVSQEILKELDHEERMDRVLEKMKELGI